MSETHEVEDKQNQLFPVGSVIKCFVVHPSWKLKKKTAEIIFLTQAGANLSRFQDARPDLIVWCSPTALWF